MRIALAGGGTTGHISPMLATAEALRRLDPHGELICVGTPIGLETAVVPAAGFELRLVDPIPLPRTLTPKLLSLPVRIIKSVRQARSVLRGFRPDAVVGFGGYASLPVYLAARSLRIPVVIHEANAVAGMANRIAARFAAAVCVTFAATNLPRQVVTGMPVRAAVAGLDLGVLRSPARQGFGLSDQAKVLLVTGGSQGARSINQALSAALPSLAAAQVAVLHITGKGNFADPVEVPEAMKYIRLPYVDNMAEAYAAADLILARSGAATVVETALVGLPAIFVPLPHGNGEQARNATGLVEAGAARLIADADLTWQRLAQEVIELLDDDATRQAMAAAAHGATPRDAADQVAGYALRLSTPGGPACP